MCFETLNSRSRPLTTSLDVFSLDFLCWPQSRLSPPPTNYYATSDKTDLPNLKPRVGRFAHVSDVLAYLNPRLKGASRGAPLDCDAAGSLEESKQGGGSGGSSSSSSSSGGSRRNVSLSADAAATACADIEAARWRDVGVVSLRDSHLGHFVEFVGALTEVGRHLPWMMPAGGGPDMDVGTDASLPHLSLFFPST